MSRRRAALATLGFVAVAAAVAAALAFGFRSSADDRPTSVEYLARIETVCRDFEQRLARIPAPTGEAPGEVVESISRALPLLEERTERARAVEPPKELEASTARFFALTKRTIRHLQAARTAALERDIVATQAELAKFFEARDAARAESDRIGFRC